MNVYAEGMNLGLILPLAAKTQVLRLYGMAFAGITCAYSVNRGALCGLQRNLIPNLHVLLMYVR